MNNTTPISCRRAVDLIIKKEEKGLTKAQRFQLWKHLSICELCRIFSSQNRTIDNMLKSREVKTGSFNDVRKGKIFSSILETDSGEG